MGIVGLETLEHPVDERDARRKTSTYARETATVSISTMNPIK
jgi:hypothetical protein